MVFNTTFNNILVSSWRFKKYYCTNVKATINIRCCIFNTFIFILFRIFGAKCSKCHQACTKNDFVMRARDNMYHIDCFRCVACSRQLIPGDEFALKDDELFCKADHDVFENDNDQNLDLDDIKIENNESPMEVINNDSNNNKRKENGLHKHKGRTTPFYITAKKIPIYNLPNKRPKGDKNGKLW